MNLKQTVAFIIIIIIAMLHIALLVLYLSASSICDKSEKVPVRYEYAGIFGVKTAIPTTPENADSYEQVCISTGKVKFYSIEENLKYLVNNSK